MEQPRIIILDIKKELTDFKNAVGPLLSGTNSTVEETLEVVWDGFYEWEDMDELIPNAIQAAIENIDIPDNTPDIADAIYSELWDFAEKLAAHVNRNGLYGTSLILPHSIRFHPTCGAYLEYNKEIHEMLNQNKID